MTLCANATPSNLPIGGPVSKSFHSDMGVTVSLDLPNTLYFTSQSVPIRITIHNDSRQSVPLIYPTIQRYDFYITDSDQNEIWRWSNNQSFPCIFLVYHLGPNEMLSYTTTWEQVDDDGQSVMPGLYYVSGVIAQNPEIATPPATISITARPEPLKGKWGPEVVVPPKRKPHR